MPAKLPLGQLSGLLFRACDDLRGNMDELIAETTHLPQQKQDLPHNLLNGRVPVPA